MSGFITSMELMIVCDYKATPGVAGSNGNCHICLQSIFISESTYHSIEENGYFKEDAVFYCIPCSKSKMPSVKEFIPLTEEQQQEIILHTSGRKWARGEN